MEDTRLYKTFSSPYLVFSYMAKRLIIVGAGDLGREVLGWMLSSGSLSDASELFFIDDSVTSLNIIGYDLVCLGSIDGFYPVDGDQLVAAIASPITRSIIVEKLLSRGCQFTSYIDPTARLSLGSRVGQGCILMPYSLVSNDSIIGDFSIINCHASVGHDVQIGSFVSISAHVDIMGYCEIRDKVFMGSGSRILPRRRIGELATIGAGATAARSVPSGRTLYTPLSKLL